ncbi:MAG: CobW family GTP-binding protein, partial [Solirubrobacteraceae bacterium]
TSLRTTMATTRREPIALTVIGGFLGAGKTTLLNRLLREAGDRRLAVLVNDFGAINIDAELVQSRDGQMVRLENGCICCGVSGDFIGELALLRDGPEPPEHVVVEASGIADPGQIVMLGDMPGYRRDAAVVLADAETVRARAADAATGHHVMGQLRAADLLVLNKTDLVTTADAAATRAWLRGLAGPSTAIVETSHGAVPADVVLGARPRSGEFSHAGHDDHDDHHHPDFGTWSWTAADPVSGAGLVEALTALPDGIVRAKGLLHLREDPANRYVLQLVGRRFSIEADRGWGDEPAASRIVVIGLPGSVDAAALAVTFGGLTA